MRDVIIAGAGPAGSIAARSLAEKGYEVLMLEEHGASGTPQHGNGLLTDETIAMSGVKPEILSSIHGFEFVFPDDTTLTVRSVVPKFRMVDLADMERKMAVAAVAAGAKVSYNDTYESHTVGDRVLVDSTTGIHRGKLLIGADGAFSKVALTLGDNRPPEYIRGIQVDVDHRMEDQEMARIFLGKSIAPGFLAWEIPCGDRTRIGLCTSWSAGDPTTYLSDLLIKLGFPDKILALYSGKVPLGDRPFLCGDRCILVGDAAGFVDPLSARGLNYAFRCNKVMMDVIPSCLDSDTLFIRDLDEYDRLCRTEVGKDIVKLREMRRKFRRLSDSDFNAMRKVIDGPQASEVFDEMNFDSPLEALSSVSGKLGLTSVFMLRNFI